MAKRVFKRILKVFLIVLGLFIILMLTPRTIGWLFPEKAPIAYHFELLDYLAIGVGLEKMADLEPEIPATIEEIKNIEYKNVGGKSLQFDIYKPKELKEPSPLLVFIHGGAWRHGQRSDYLVYLVDFAEKGYMTATVSYRLDTIYPGCAEDIADAVDWIFKNGGAYGVDTSRIALIGGSAGGHLSLLGGYNWINHRPQQDSIPVPFHKLKAVVDIYGPVDFTTPYAQSHPLITRFIGYPYSEKPELYWDASPAKYLHKDLPATLIFQGTSDKLVPTVSSGNEDITIDVSTLTKNFEKTIAIVQEMLLEPRWDVEQFGLAKSRIINNLKRNQASPDYLASTTLNKLVFGDNNILGVEATGTEQSVTSITIDDLKAFYEKYFSPSTAKLLVAGDVDQARVEAAFADLSQKWPAKEVTYPAVTAPAAPEKSAIYFVDIPGAKQSVIAIGGPEIPRTDPEFYPAYVANYKLGGSFNGIFNLILREEKGFTYGARSNVSGYKNYGIFSASSRVRTNSTLESVTIFKTEMEKYRENMPQEYVDFTKDALIKGNALRFETLGSLLGMLNTMTAYDLPADYIKTEEAYVQALTPEKQLEMAKKYIDPSKMYYVVVGDAATQLEPLEKVGLGKPILVKQ